MDYQHASEMRTDLKRLRGYEFGRYLAPGWGDITGSSALQIELATGKERERQRF
jgi:hypothetical protein